MIRIKQLWKGEWGEIRRVDRIFLSDSSKVYEFLFPEGNMNRDFNAAFKKARFECAEKYSK